MEKVKLPYVPLIWVCSRMDRRNTVFLDSSMRNDLGRRSYLGMVPYDIHTPADSDLIGTLDDIGENTLMGFITYDQGLEMHGIQSEHPGTGIPGFILADFDIILEEDHVGKELTAVCGGRVMSSEEEMDLIAELLSRASEPSDPDIPRPASVTLSSGSDFIQSVEMAREMMANGEFYVVNLSRRMTIQSDADPYDVFLGLRRISPSPFGAYIDMNGIQVISSSMELLLDTSDGRAWTRPIKGTVPRTGDVTKDGDNLQRLLSSEKDRSELLMVTDMERNDMNRFCVPGSVEVKGFFHPEEYSTLYHTVSDIIGTVEERTGIGRMVECMFPGGSVTGAPKHASMLAIDQLEDSGRGLYTGSIGLFSKERTVMNITIRTMVHRNGTYEMGIGGGITYESNADSELRETEQKGLAMRRALNDGTR